MRGWRRWRRRAARRLRRCALRRQLRHLQRRLLRQPHAVRALWLRLQRDAAAQGGRSPALCWLRGGLERLLVSTATQLCGVPAQRMPGIDDTFQLRFNGGDLLRLSFQHP